MAEGLLKREDILRITAELDFFGGEDYWLTSGAALVLYGVKESTRDVDIICTKELADRLEERGFPFQRSGLDGSRIFTISAEVEALEDWETEEISEAAGLRAASLWSIRRQKEALGREKDWRDIRLIDSFLGKEA